MRVILYTGKGGVGKTSVAAATALKAAELGYKTIAISTDAAHSLADSFEVTLGNEPQPIATNLWGQETDISQTLSHRWGTVEKWLTALLAWRGIQDMVASEMAILPGMEELANLLYILDYYEKDNYQVIIVDCAPTGETLKLLSFPDMLRWWMERFFPLERKAAGLIRPVMKAFTNVPFPEDAVFQSAQSLFEQLNKMRSILTNPEVSSVRLVVNPEKMVIKETQRTFTYLNLYGYATDLIACNRLIPDQVADHYFDSWKQTQTKYRQDIEERFSPIPIRGIPLFSQEVLGIPMLRAMADALFGPDDPTQVFFHGQPHTFHKEDNHYVLTMLLPFASKQDISLSQNGDELIVQVGSYRRNIVLPRTISGLSASEAKFEKDHLKIRFSAEGKTAAGGEEK